MANLYPQKNPFPYQGTLSIEGSQVEFEPDEFSLKPPTLLWTPLLRVADFTISYLEALRSEKGPGQVLILNGDHGSGKTHAIQYAIGRVGNDAASQQNQFEKPVQVYVKVEGPDFLAVYRRIMVQVPFEVLKTLVSRFIGVLAGEQFGREIGDSQAGEREAERLRKDPGQVYELFRLYRIEEGAVQEQATKEIDRVSGGMDDFQRALSYLLTPNLGTVAYDWLVGRPVGLDATKMLGVSGPIASDEVGKWVIQLLVTLFNRAQQPLIIYLDQYEKLVLDKDNTLIPQNAGILHSLVEIVPRENCMLLLSGNREAWQALSKDLQQRFGFNIVDFPVLTLKEAEELTHIYLFPSDTTSDPSRRSLQSDEQLFPFTKSGIREVLRFSSGNIRRFLQISSTLFDANTTHGKIDAAFATKTLKRYRRVYFDESTVTEEIERLLNQRALRFIKKFEFEGAFIDFAVVDSQDSPRLLVETRSALFYDDEARNALKSLNIAERIHLFRTPARLVLIVLGYVSPVVLDTLSRFTQELIVYSPDTFRVNFSRVLDEIRPETLETGVSPNSEMIERQLDEVRARLELLVESRNYEAKALQDRLTEFIQAQISNRQSDQHSLARQAWLVEKDALEERIREAREKRRDARLAELEDLRTKAEVHKRRRDLLFVGTFALLTVMILVLMLVGTLQSTYEPRLYIWPIGNTLLMLLTFAMMFAVTLVLTYLRFAYIGPRPKSELAARVNSFDDLERIARSYVSFSARGPSQLLRNDNPHFRFAGVLKADPNADVELLKQALLVERSSLVRQAIAKRIAESDRLEDLLNDKTVLSLRESPYIVEAAANQAKLPMSSSQLPSEHLQLLAAICGIKVEGDSSNLALRLVTSIHNKSQGRAKKSSALLNAFEQGLDRYSSPELTQLPETDVRSAIQKLSPLEEPGLGTYDELRNIERIDRYYIFFRQLLFWLERGLLGRR